MEFAVWDHQPTKRLLPKWIKRIDDRTSSETKITEKKQFNEIVHKKRRLGKKYNQHIWTRCFSIAWTQINDRRHTHLNWIDSALRKHFSWPWCARRWNGGSLIRYKISRADDFDVVFYVRKLFTERWAWNGNRRVSIKWKPPVINSPGVVYGAKQTNWEVNKVCSGWFGGFCFTSGGSEQF